MFRVPAPDRLRRLVAIAIVALAAGGCGSDVPTTTPANGPPTASAPAATGVGPSVPVPSGATPAPTGSGPAGSPTPSGPGPSSQPSPSASPSAPPSPIVIPTPLPSTPGGPAVAAWRAQRYPNWAVLRDGAPGLLLPVGEQALATNGSLTVSSVTPVGGGYRPSTLVVRVLGSSAAPVLVPVADAVSSGAIAGGALWFTGDNADLTDPGLLRLDPTTSTVTQVVAGGPWPADWSHPGRREDVLVSSSGRTIASPVCGSIVNVPPHCWVDVINVPKAVATRSITDIPERPWLISDTAVIARNDYPQRLAVYDIATGRQRWTVSGLFSTGYVTPNGRTLVAVGRTNIPGPEPTVRTRIVAFDLATGKQRELWVRDGNEAPPAIWPELSRADRVAVGERPLEDVLNGGRSSARADTLLIASGRRAANAVTIRAAFGPDVASVVDARPALPQTEPFRIASVGSDTSNTVLISSAADCAAFSDGRLGQLCSFVLPSDWRATGADAPPFPTDDPRWTATIDRAALDGDLGICDDVGLKTLYAAPTTGGPAPADLVSDRVGPIAACRDAIRNREQGLPGGAVLIEHRPGARAPLPPADPGVLCTWDQSTPYPREACTRVLAAILDDRGATARDITYVAMSPQALTCSIDTCPAPAGGTLLIGGRIVTGNAPAVGEDFNAFDVGGRVVVVTAPTSGPTASPLPSP